MNRIFNKTMIKYTYQVTRSIFGLICLNPRGLYLPFALFAIFGKESVKEGLR